MWHSIAMLMIVSIGGIVDILIGRVKEEPELLAVPLSYVLLGAAFLGRTEAGARNGHESVAASIGGYYPMRRLIRAIMKLLKITRLKELEVTLDRATEAHEKAFRGVMQDRPKTWGHTAR